MQHLNIPNRALTVDCETELKPFTANRDLISAVVALRDKISITCARTQFDTKNLQTSLCQIAILQGKVELLEDFLIALTNSIEE